MRRFTAIILALIVVGAATADEPLQISYPRAVASIPVLALMDAYPDDYSGAFFSDHPLALAQLINGQVDLLFTGYAVGYSRAMAAGDIVHLATPVWGASALMTAEPVERLADLAGGTIYAPFEGSPIDIYLRAVLEAESLTDTVALAYAPFPQAAALLAEGRAAGAVLVEPIASRLEIAGVAHRFENLHEGWARIADGEQRSPQVSLFAHRSSIEDNRTRLARMVRRLEAIVDRVAADPATYAARYASALGFPPPVLERALTNTLFDTPSAATTRRLMSQYAAITGAAEPPDSFFRAVR